MHDEIIEELWAVRDALAERSGRDIHEIARRYALGVPDPRDGLDVRPRESKRPRREPNARRSPPDAP